MLQKGQRNLPPEQLTSTIVLLYTVTMYGIINRNALHAMSHKKQRTKNPARIALWEKKQQCDEIRKGTRETWTIKDIGTLLTYKQNKSDPVIARAKASRLLMLEGWNLVAHQTTPPC
jgi:hypothetical protein